MFNWSNGTHGSNVKSSYATRDKDCQCYYYYLDKHDSSFKTSGYSSLILLGK
jgi:hypothetical protein